MTKISHGRNTGNDDKKNMKEKVESEDKNNENR